MQIQYHTVQKPCFSCKFMVSVIQDNQLFCVISIQIQCFCYTDSWFLYTEPVILRYRNRDLHSNSWFYIRVILQFYIINYKFMVFRANSRLMYTEPVISQYRFRVLCSNSWFFYSNILSVFCDFTNSRFYHTDSRFLYTDSVFLMQNHGFINL